MRLRRFESHAPTGHPLILARDHAAVTEGRTLFPSTRRAPGGARLLKSGMNSRKIGRLCTKGKWRGMPIYTLSLEERATCPRSCAEWRSCYGNHMHLAQRQAHGPELESQLELELRDLQAKHFRGFIVRLHVLGDFYSADYVRRWLSWLVTFPALRVFGYTAWPSNTDIGSLLHGAAIQHWDRFAIRLSSAAAKIRGAKTVDAAAPGDLICPAQTDKTDCCGTCALCWQTQRNIVFLRH